MMCAAASTSAADRGRAPNTPSSATMTTASMSTSPKPARPQVPRHPPPAPVEQRRRLGPDRRVLERGVDPDAQHRGLVRRARRGSGAATGAGRSCPSARRASATSGISVTAAPTACTARDGEDARELLLVPEVAVEGAVRHAGGGRRDRRPGCCGSRARRTRRAPRRAARRARRCRTRPGRPAPSVPEQLEHLGAELERRRRRAVGGVHVHVGAQRRTTCGGGRR